MNYLNGRRKKIIDAYETDDIIFLKTIIPSRKATKKYLRG